MSHLGESEEGALTAGKGSCRQQVRGWGGGVDRTGIGLGKVLTVTSTMSPSGQDVSAQLVLTSMVSVCQKHRHSCLSTDIEFAS